MLHRGRVLSLWGLWWNAMQLLRPAFSRSITFMWFATIVAGMAVRADTLGVTSIVRALNLTPVLYHRLLANFHSTGVKLDRLVALWTQLVLRLFTSPVRVNGRLVVVGDGIKAPKRGRKMPAVKLLHQQSESNTKPEYIMGHSMQAVACWYTRPRASSRYRSRRASTKAWYGPIATGAPCSTRCSACSISWRSRRRSTSLLMPTTPPARWCAACSCRATIS